MLIMLKLFNSKNYILNKFQIFHFWNILLKKAYWTH